jgi:ornithine cyclodeaminase
LRRADPHGFGRRSCAEADIVVTASRSPSALFSGDLLKPGCFVAAVGSSLPNTRELDDRAMARAALVAVEWRDQSLREAGDLVLADPKALPADKIVELGEILAGKARGRACEDEITIYKSVGVGMQDIALAGLAAHRRLSPMSPHLLPRCCSSPHSAHVPACPVASCRCQVLCSLEH